MAPDEYEQIDADLKAGRRRWDRDFAIAYAQGVEFHPMAPAMQPVKQISMLGLDTLMMCRGYAMTSRTGMVLEIGSYIGGSTVALARGLREAAGARVVSIDPGGAWPHQPFLPSDDIHADWAKNVASFGVADLATMVKGYSHEPAVKAQVREIAAGRKFDVFFMDALGEVRETLRDYGDMLTDDCLFILDDYYNVMGATEKALRCAAQVHDLMRDGVLEQYVLTPWSTWVGRRTG